MPTANPKSRLGTKVATGSPTGDQIVLSALQKAEILVRAGVAVPPLPANRNSPNELPLRWRRDVDALYATYNATRAARSLREAQEAQTMARLRRANDRHTHPDDEKD
jgi:hypothetical protein